MLGVFGLMPRATHPSDDRKGSGGVLGSRPAVAPRVAAVVKAGAYSATLPAAVADHHYQAVAALPQLLKRATRFNSHPDRKGSARIVAIHRMAAPLKVDASPYVAHLTVKERDDGIGFYDHYLRLVPAERPATEDGMKVGDVHATVDDGPPMKKGALIVFR